MSGSGRDEFQPVASQVPFDPDNCDSIDSEDVQGAIEDLCQVSELSASPGYQFGREGIHNPGTWLVAAETLSNKRGLPFGLNNGGIRKVTISTQNTPAAFTVEIWYHSGNLSGAILAGSVTTTGGLDTEDFVVDWAIPKNKQLAAKVSSVGNPKPQETGIFLVVKGELS